MIQAREICCSILSLGKGNLPKFLQTKSPACKHLSLGIPSQRKAIAVCLRSFSSRLFQCLSQVRFPLTWFLPVSASVLLVFPDAVTTLSAHPPSRALGAPSTPRRLLR